MGGGEGKGGKEGRMEALFRVHQLKPIDLVNNLFKNANIYLWSFTPHRECLEKHSCIFPPNFGMEGSVGGVGMDRGHFGSQVLDHRWFELERPWVYHLHFPDEEKGAQLTVCISASRWGWMPFIWKTVPSKTHKRRSLWWKNCRPLPTLGSPEYQKAGGTNAKCL